ncbi:MAG: hypothetical protein KFW21_00035 [Spirochaetota bacterium]|nr:hypothetical protein [Spirochaetota bacterium]
MFKFILTFVFLSLYAITNLFAMKPKAPPIPKSLVIFNSIKTDTKKQIIYHESVPIIAENSNQKSLSIQSFFSFNEITGNSFFQMKLYYDKPSADSISNTVFEEPSKSTIEYFDPFSIAFIFNNNKKFIPIIKSSTSLITDSQASCIGSIYLFQDDISNFRFNRDSGKPILNVILKNNKEEEIILSFSDQDIIILAAILNFYKNLHQYYTK